MPPNRGTCAVEATLANGCEFMAILQDDDHPLVRILDGHTIRPVTYNTMPTLLAAEAEARAAEKRRADEADRSLRAIRAMRDDDTRAFNARIDELEAERDAIAEQMATLRAAAVCSEIGSDGDGKAYLTCLYCGDGGSVEIPDEIVLLSDEDSQTRTWLQAIKKYCLHDHGCPMASPAEPQEAAP